MNKSRGSLVAVLHYHGLFGMWPINELAKAEYPSAILTSMAEAELIEPEKKNLNSEACSVKIKISV